VLSKHRTERGSAGSNSVFCVLVVFDPALPRSVLCLLNTAHTGHRVNYPLSIFLALLTRKALFFLNPPVFSSL